MCPKVAQTHNPTCTHMPPSTSSLHPGGPPPPWPPPQEASQAPGHPAPQGSPTAGSLRPKGPPGAQAPRTDTLPSRTGRAAATRAHLSRAPAEAALENPLTSFPRVWASPAGAGPGLASSAGEGAEEEEPLRASSVPPSGRRGGTGPWGQAAPAVHALRKSLRQQESPLPTRPSPSPVQSAPPPPQQVRATIPVGSGKQACQRRLRSTPHFTDGETEAQQPEETNVT